MQKTPVCRNRFATTMWSLVTITLVSVSLTGCDLTSIPGSSGESGTSGSSPVSCDLPPASLEEAEAVAEEFAAAMTAGDVDRIDACFDTDAFCDMILSQIEFPGSQEKAGFTKGVRTGLNSNSIGKQLTQNPIDSYTILKAREIEGEVCVLARFLDVEGSLNYHDIYFAKDENDEAHIVDMYVIATGERTTTTIANLGAQALGLTPSFLQRLAGKNDESMKAMEVVKGIPVACREGQFERAVTLYDQLPEVLQENSAIFCFYFTSLIQLEDLERADAAIRKQRSRLDDTRTIDFLSIDLYFLTEEYDKAINSLQRLYEYTEDPYLIYLQGNAYLEQGEKEETLAAFQQAMDEQLNVTNIELEAAYWAMEWKRWEYAANCLDHFESLSGEINYEGLAEYPNFQEFLDSEHGKPWR